MFFADSRKRGCKAMGSGLQWSTSRSGLKEKCGDSQGSTMVHLAFGGLPVAH